MSEQRKHAPYQDRWQIFWLGSPEGLSARIYVETPDGKSVDVAHAPKEWCKDVDRLQFLLRACNSHDDLVKALKRAVYLLQVTKRFISENNLEEYESFWDETRCDGSCLCDDAETAADTGKDAIAKAEGKVTP